MLPARLRTALPGLIFLLAYAPDVLGQNFLFDLQNSAISDEFSSESFGISDDGQFIVGRGTPSQRAWRLDANLIPIFLGADQGAVLGTAYGLSHDGSVAVGQVQTLQGNEAFRWTSATGTMAALGDLPGGAFESGAYDVSADGSVVVGYGVSPGGLLSGTEAFRWTLDDPATGNGTMIGLGDLTGGDTSSRAFAVSADGSVVVGSSSSQRSGHTSAEAFRWTLANPENGDGVMVGLGDLPGGGFSSTAIDVSADGSVAVGQGLSANGAEAFLWSNGNMIGLGDLPGGNFWSVANAVSADGSVVVGHSATGINDAGFDVFRPFIWDRVNGMRDLVQLFADDNLVMPDLFMTSATGISADGTTVTGIGRSRFRIPAGDARTEAWWGRLHSLPPNPGDFDGNGMLDAGDIDRLSQAVRDGDVNPMFDINWDGNINASDRRNWVQQFKRTFFGDANLDGEFNSGDMVGVFTAGEYEDGIPKNSGWAEGDWDGTGDFDSGDFVVAFTDGGYERGPRDAVRAVPEPTPVVMLMAGLVGIAIHRRRVALERHLGCA